MSEFGKYDYESDVAVEEAQPKLKRPPMFKVIILNDDFTPMEFVVGMLITFFAMSQQKARHIMLEVHKQGKAICGTYSRDIAETKVAQVNSLARQYDYPLLCIMEAV